jgi:hypothetical protein
LIDSASDWLAHISAPIANRDERFTLKDLQKVMGQVSAGAAKSMECRACEAEAKFMVPGYGICCKAHLPPGAEVVDFDQWIKKNPSDREGSVGGETG